jgi:peptide/nickel transport system substrate-binding protein
MVIVRRIFVAVLAFCAVVISCSAFAADRTLVLRMERAIPSLDWEQTTQTADMKVWHQMFEGLYGMDEAHGGYYKELAKEVKISKDQKTYTVTLIDGVTFQNGDPLKASDVVFSYNRARKNSRFNYLTSMIKDVKAIDNKTVEFLLNQPYSPIAHTFFCIKITSEREVTGQGAKYGTIPHKAGTGAYYVSEYNIATGLKMEAYKGYWRGAPNIKNVQYVVIDDLSAAVIAFENNELNYFDDVPMSEWEDVKKAAGKNNALKMGNNILFMGINYLSPTNKNVLGNLKVREAISYAVNKHDINLAVSDGLGAEADQYMLSDYVPTSPASGFNTYAYNPEKSKQLLKEAGFPNGVNVGTIQAYGASTGPNAIMAQVIQANLAEVGITAQVSVMEPSVVTPRLYAQDYDICIFSDSSNYDFNNIRQQVHSESVGMYVVRYKDPKSPFNWKRIEQLVDLGVGTADVKQRVKYYTELWKIVADTATILPCINRPVGIVWSQGLSVGSPVPTYYKVRQFKWL